MGKFIFKKTNKEKTETQVTEEEVYITVDDLIALSEQLNQGLIRLSGYKHPLKVRKGGWKEVIGMNAQEQLSRTLKAGKRTYFFDIKETKDGKPYLVITESWFKKEAQEDEPPVRNTLMVFPEQAQDFAMTATVMLAKITEG